ncbi:hypothetical protein CMK11_10675 [Candidatus Poribacteria bacterium]|nr:hypothetical protein [Candidatus Poribacteria bacterium]
MHIAPDGAILLLLLLTAVVNLGAGLLIGGARKRQQLARAEERMAGDTGERIDSVLHEVKELREHVADLTFMIDGTNPRTRLSAPPPPDRVATRE